MAMPQEFWVLIIEVSGKILKSLLLLNHLAQMLQICYIALPSCFYKDYTNGGLRVQNDPAQGDSGIKT